MPRPTPEGERRYPPDGYFDDLPCTCQDDCEFDCRGDCGCKACRAADGEKTNCDQHEAVAEVCGAKHEVTLSEEEEATKSAALMVLRRYFQLPDDDAKAKAPRKPPKAHTRGKQTPTEG